MADKSFQLDIVTPMKLVYSGKVESVTAPGTEGYFQVLHNHTPFLTSIQIGEIRIKEKGKKQYYSTSGGFAEVHENQVSILAEAAEKVEEIDLERAEASKLRAQKLLEASEEGVDTDRARYALIRAMNRIQLGSQR